MAGNLIRRMLSEWLMLTALTWLVGSVAVPVMVMSSPAAQPLRDATRQVRRVHIILGCTLLIIASIMALAFPITRYSDGRLVLVLVMRLCLIGLIGASLMRGSRYIGVVFMAGFALLLMQSLLSRGALQQDLLAPLANDWLHLTLSTIWVGGLGLLAFVLVPATLRKPALQPALSAALERFSPVAMFCAIGLGLTGILQATQVVNGFQGLVETSYGRLVLAKVGLFAVLVCFGALHQFVIMPRLRPRLFAGVVPLVRTRFALTIGAELLVSVIVLAISATLKAAIV